MISAGDSGESGRATEFIAHLRAVEEWAERPTSLPNPDDLPRLRLPWPLPYVPRPRLPIPLPDPPPDILGPWFEVAGLAQLHELAQSITNEAARERIQSALKAEIEIRLPDAVHHPPPVPWRPPPFPRQPQTLAWQQSSLVRAALLYELAGSLEDIQLRTELREELAGNLQHELRELQ